MSNGKSRSYYSSFMLTFTIKRLFYGLFFVLFAWLVFGYHLNLDFVNSLFPEVLGMLIELILILFVVDKVRDNEDRKRKIFIERRLRELFIFFLDANFSKAPFNCRTGRFYGQDYEDNQNAIQNLINYFSGKGFESKVLCDVVMYCSKEKVLFNNLLSVASELTNDHFKAWMRITYFVNFLSTMQNKISLSSDEDKITSLSENEAKEIEESILKILSYIKIFDKESYKNDLYVGAGEGDNY